MTPSLQNVVGGLDLRCCDCMDLMRECADKAFDLAIVDPPYGIGASTMQMGPTYNSRKWKRSSDWDKKAPDDAYFAELFRVSKRQIVWGGNYFSLPVSRGWVFWDKGVGEGMSFSDGELAWSSFDKALKKVRIDHTGFRISETKIHPTQKPVKLYNWLLAEFAKPGDRILDTHLGSGSIAIACHYAGHHLTACEIDRDYYEAALQRIKRETAQMTLLDTPNIAVSGGLPATGKTYTERAGSVRKSQ